ncbi:hypothetical protein SAMN05216569_1632 [Pseudoxanthomonas sp. CF125]|nr:hypothetical protein SAMN05216569_1632 [Pseudoxanthomonas sp. CF125]
MEIAKRTGALLACAAGLDISLSVLALFHANTLIQQTAVQCAAQTSDICRQFVPWLWTGIAFALIAAVASIAWFARRKRFASWLAPIVFAASLLPVGYSTWLWLQPSEQASTQKDVGRARQRDDDLAKRIEQARAQVEPESLRPRGHHPFPDLPLSRDGLQLADDPFMATSKAEQSWLDRNGYPNAKQWAAYAQASDQQLREAAEQGDRGAKAILDHRRLMAGDDAAVTDLLTEGAKGSGFALDMLASYLASNRGGDRQTAYAVSRVSEMRGNFRIAAARDLMFDVPLTNSERMQGDLEAMDIYNKLYELQRKIRGPSSPPVDPRPIDG